MAQARRMPKLIYYANNDITTPVPEDISELNDTDIQAGDLVVPELDYHGEEVKDKIAWSYDDHIAVVVTNDRNELVLEYPWLDDGGEEILNAQYLYMHIHRRGIFSAKPLELGLANGFKLSKLLAFYRDGASAIVLPLSMQRSDLEVTDEGHIAAVRIYDYYGGGVDRITAMGRAVYGEYLDYYDIEDGMPSIEISNVAGQWDFTVDNVFTDAAAALGARQQAAVQKGDAKRTPMAWKYRTTLEFALHRLRDYLQPGDVLYGIYDNHDPDDDNYYYVVDRNKNVVPIDTVSAYSCIPGWVADYVVDTLGYTSVTHDDIWRVYSKTVGGRFVDEPLYMVAPWREQGDALVLDSDGTVAACRVYDLRTGDQKVHCFTEDKKHMDDMFSSHVTAGI